MKLLRWVTGPSWADISGCGTDSTCHLWSQLSSVESSRHSSRFWTASALPEHDQTWINTPKRERGKIRNTYTRCTYLITSDQSQMNSRAQLYQSFLTFGYYFIIIYLTWLVKLQFILSVILPGNTSPCTSSVWWNEYTADFSTFQFSMLYQMLD